MNNNNNAIAFSLVVLSGAILAGCGFVAESSPTRSNAELAIAVGFVVGGIGLISLWAECTKNWEFVRRWLLIKNESPARDDAKD